MRYWKFWIEESVSWPTMLDREGHLVSENVKSVRRVMVCNIGGLAHMVERPLSMREAPGSIPGSSTLFC